MRIFLATFAAVGAFMALGGCDDRPTLTAAQEKQMLESCKNEIWVSSLFLGGVKDGTSHKVSGKVGDLNWYCCEREKSYPAFEVKFRDHRACYFYLKKGELRDRTSARKCAATRVGGGDEMCRRNY